MSPSRVNDFIHEPQKLFAYNLGQPLRGITFKWKDHSVLMVVKTYNRKRQPIVGFIETDSYYACWEYLYEYMTKTNVPLKWKDDAYA